MDNKLKNDLDKWQAKQPSTDLANRIFTNAIAHEQERSFIYRVEKFLENIFSDWNYGLNYKVATLCICAVLGAIYGNINAVQDQDYLYGEYEISEL